MGKTWVLDTETKGTGANMVPLEKVQKKADGERRRPSRPARTAPAGPSRARRTREPVETSATALPQIGKIRSVDPRAGTATVHWLKRGAASTVPLSAITRR